MALAVGAAGGAEAGKADDTLNVAVSGEAATLDNYKIASREGLIIARHLFDNLLYKDLDTNTIVPALATSYDFIDNPPVAFWNERLSTAAVERVQGALDRMKVG